MTRPAGVRLRPTRLGTAFFGLVLLTLIGCINYSLSLGYGLTFLLGGVWIITAAQALRAVRLLGVTVLPPAQAAVGEKLAFTVQVQQLGPAGNVRVLARPTQGGVAGKPLQGSGVARPDELLHLSLPVPAPVRGPLHLTGVQVAAVDTLGLWHASLPAPDSEAVLVTPRAEANAPTPRTLKVTGTGDAVQRTRGHDEFAGVRAYQPGDSPRLISWKHVARTGTLLTREFDAPAGEGLNLDWNETAGAGTVESRVSRLAAWVAHAQQQKLPFSMNLPAFTLNTGQGEGQVRAALNALAQVRPLPQPSRDQEEEARRPFAPRQPDVLPAGALRFSFLALAFSLLPGLPQWPAWVWALLAGVLGYAALQVDPRRRLPHVPPLALLLSALLAGAGLNASFGTLLGQQAGTALLAVLLALKAAETRTYRDAKLLSLLGLFLLITHFFHSQGPVTAVQVVVASALLLSAAARWVNPATWAGPVWQGQAWRQVGRLMLLATPVAALLFSFFPRPDGPLWRLPLQQNRTGLSDEINAGEYSNLAKDNSVAFRADFGGGAVPPSAERYWRGPVYEEYDGVKWTQALRASFTFAPPSIETTRNAAYRYALTLEPSGKPWLLALESVTQVPPNSLITTGFQAATFRPAAQRTRYELQSQVARTGRREDPRRLELNLFLPAGQNPRATALAAPWRSLPPAERVRRASEYLARGGFTYTLDPPTLPQDNRIDAFLFGSRTGFCEHYASAFAFLMRSAGVPARVVGGYQGGELNPAGDYLIVRQQDAHAWTEVWLAGQGWVRVDPTALIAPARVNTNLGTALSQPNATTARPRSTWQQLALRFDAFQNNWNNWVAGYDGEQQRTLLSRLGVSGVGSAPYMLALLVGVLLVLLPIFALVRRSARPGDPAQAALFDLSEKLKLPRQPGETASAYAQRAAQQYPALEKTLREIAERFNLLRYGPAAPPERLKELRHLIRQLRR
ncbi:transglutaminaseTgpA domain-containing protein [Deinococcus fonticola]|uniref:transglutaminaseTgpA domain-containing protein n=1 Tax=Deinococcus fonticola TaxID=2528713 RepID=UPI001074CB4D|nr:transglutaminaseTgpA domain-containing protein [Deinococcus fonticola]